LGFVGLLVFALSGIGLGCVVYLYRKGRIDRKTLVFWLGLWTVLAGASFKIEIIAIDLNLISDQWVRLSPSFVAILSVITVILSLQVLSLNLRFTNLNRQITAINRAISLYNFRVELEKKNR